MVSMAILLLKEKRRKKCPDNFVNRNLLLIVVSWKNSSTARRDRYDLTLRSEIIEHTSSINSSESTFCGRSINAGLSVTFNGRPLSEARRSERYWFEQWSRTLGSETDSPRPRSHPKSLSGRRWFHSILANYNVSVIGITVRSCYGVL